MSSRGTSITINGIHPSAVNGGVKKIEKYRDQILTEKINKTIGDVAKRFTDVASSAFGAGVGFSTEKVGEFNYQVTAFSLPGTQLITFLEFGTGNPVNSDNDREFVSAMEQQTGIGIYAGSWSEMDGHAHTYEAWQNNQGYRKEDGSYLYDKKPRRGIQLGMEAARKYVEDMAKRAK